ncbi:kinase-like domain-containing protein [Endogone sp. FLAS-F59071]|nr:kinase-like domain-containing protein [Endogone sp. FLAS-F59071]|eukprot:RUS13168.1 kinase-like domain-containing protein [Endogone sp. FLAS-F59071]
MRVFSSQADRQFCVGSNTAHNLDIVNSDFTFVRPEKDQERPAVSNNIRKRLGKNIPELHIDVELSRNELFFNTSPPHHLHQGRPSITRWSDDELRQSTVALTSTSRQPSCIKNDNLDNDQQSRFYEALGFPHVRRRASMVEPQRPDSDFNSLLPALSPSSSSSSLASTMDSFFPQSPPSPTTTLQDHRPSPKSKASQEPVLIRRTKTPSSAAAKHRMSWSPSPVTASSWSDVPVSPAASFLSAFGACDTPICDEEGDEIGEYVLGKIIGYGGFSTVREGYRVDEKTGNSEKVALKIVKKDLNNPENPGVLFRLEREVAVWRMLDHPNIVRFHELMETDFAFFVVSEFCPGGHLLDYITSHGKFGIREDDARRIFRQLCQAVRYLHDDMKVCHKDLKLENVLFDADGNVKLCDFGLAEFQNDDVAHYFLSSSPLTTSRRSSLILLDLEEETAGGSLAYASPEQLRSSTPLRCPSSDIWSLGVILYALVTGRLPFMDEYEPRMQYKIMNGRYEDPDKVSHECCDLIRQCLNPKPLERIDIRQILDSEWVDY